MAFYRVPTEFLLVILCALTTLSLHFHGTHIACTGCYGIRTSLSRRLHCADGVTSKKSMQISGTVAIGI